MAEHLVFLSSNKKVDMNLLLYIDVRCNSSIKHLFCM